MKRYILFLLLAVGASAQWQDHIPIYWQGLSNGGVLCTYNHNTTEHTVAIHCRIYGTATGDRIIFSLPVQADDIYATSLHGAWLKSTSEWIALSAAVGDDGTTSFIGAALYDGSEPAAGTIIDWRVGGVYKSIQ